MNPELPIALDADTLRAALAKPNADIASSRNRLAEIMNRQKNTRTKVAGLSLRMNVLDNYVKELEARYQILYPPISRASVTPGVAGYYYPINDRVLRAG